MAVTPIVAVMCSFLPLLIAPMAPAASVGAAERLVRQMQRQRLDFVAARDPADDGRYVAAMRNGDYQLYLIAARHKQPALIDTRLARRQYERVYRQLETASLREGRLFVQDLNGLGLRASAGPGEAFDIVYVSAEQRTAFHGDWQGQGLSREAYERAFVSADACYTRALEILLNAARGARPASRGGWEFRDPHDAIPRAVRRRHRPASAGGPTREPSSPRVTDGD
jgi:hypothetical protein